jgi:RimJ/RimL family protein N-acetyltransferase
MAISLRKVKLSDKKYFAKWWNDQDLRKLTSGRPGTISDNRVDEYFSAIIKSKKDYHFMIILNRKAIGHVNLSKRNDNWYETQIIIGKKKYQEKGYGAKAIKELINEAKYGGIFKIYLEVRPDNLRAIRVYEKCGFVGVGIKKYLKNKYLPICRYFFQETSSLWQIY